MNLSTSMAGWSAGGQTVSDRSISPETKGVRRQRWLMRGDTLSIWVDQAYQATSPCETLPRRHLGPTGMDTELLLYQAPLSRKDSRFSICCRAQFLLQRSPLIQMGNWPSNGGGARVGS